MSSPHEDRFRYREDILCFADYDPTFMSVIYITGGHVGLKIDSAFVYVTAPHIICLNAGQEVELLSAFKLSAFSVSFPPAFLNLKITAEKVTSENWSKISEDQSFPPLDAFQNISYSYHRILPIESWLQPMANDFFNACAAECSKDGKDWGCRTRTHLLLLLRLVDILCRRYISTEKRIDPELQMLQDAIDHIQLNFTKDIDLTHLYKMAKMNRNKFNKLFYKQLSMTVSGYITKCRIGYAKELLSSTSKSIDYISEKSGYKYSSYFVRVFKKETGTTPDIFRTHKIWARIHM